MVTDPYTQELTKLINNGMASLGNYSELYENIHSLLLDLSPPNYTLTSIIY